MLTYQFAMGYPISTYCEYGLLVLQGEANEVY